MSRPHLFCWEWVARMEVSASSNLLDASISSSVVTDFDAVPMLPDKPSQSFRPCSETWSGFRSSRETNCSSEAQSRGCLPPSSSTFMDCSVSVSTRSTFSINLGSGIISTAGPREACIKDVGSAMDSSIVSPTLSPRSGCNHLLAPHAPVSVIGMRCSKVVAVPAAPLLSATLKVDASKQMCWLASKFKEGTVYESGLMKNSNLALNLRCISLTGKSFASSPKGWSIS
mmetsp:Transcript_12884/g.30633  ORF Transcript_12884/g.30633 Transcript_12884/m.30633 type:complete len:228 (-) Transcript_12884:881-1564(-)